MSSERDARLWMSYAEDDLRVSDELLNLKEYSAGILHAQQAAEKALKAVIVALTGKPPPYLHDAKVLLGYIKGFDVPDAIAAQAVILDPYYIMTRYPPRPQTIILADKADSLLRAAQEVCQWCSTQLSVIAKSRSS